MKKYSILLAAAAVFAAASCAKEAPAPEEIAPAGEQTQTTEEQTLTNPITITFSANAETKVSLVGEGSSGAKTAVWDENDQVKIIWFNSAESTMKSATVTVDSHGTASTTFTVTVEEADYYYAVYPASVEATLDGEGNFSVNFPNSAQAPTSFAGAAWYVAKTTMAAKDFAFHPISTVIKFTLDDSVVENPNQIYFRSMNGGLNRLHGHAAVTFAADNTLTAAPDPNATTPYDGAGNVTYNVSGKGTYYIPLPGYGAGYTYSAKGETSLGTSGTDGFILWIKKSGENYPAAYYSGTITQQPGKFYNIKNPVDTKIVTDYYVATASQGSGDGLSQANAATLSDLKTNAPAFKYSGFIAGALLLNGATINFLSGTYSEPLAPFNTNDYANAHSYTIKGGIDGTTTFTTSASSLFDETKPTITIKDITFDGCTTEPAVAVSAGTVNLDNVTFNACTSQGLNVSGGTVNASNGAAFTNNTTYEAAYINGGSMNLDHVTFSGNSARGLYIATGTVKATDCEFSDNARTEVSPTNESTSGGAVYINGGENTDASFAKCSFNNNSNVGYAGGVVVITGGAKTKATFKECTFTCNSAEHGGIAYTGAGEITFQDCTIGGTDENANTATTYGGVFYNNSSINLNLTILGGEISYNHAKGSGVYYSGPNGGGLITFKGVQIHHNRATAGAGGVVLADKSPASLSLVNCTVNNNSSTGVGGVISSTGTSGTITLSGGKFSYNVSGSTTRNTGGIVNYNPTSSSTDLVFKADNVLFLGNSSSSGAILYVATNFAGKAYFTNCRALDNSGTTNGTSIHMAGTVPNRILALNNCLFYENVGKSGTGTIGVNAQFVLLNSTLIDSSNQMLLRTGSRTGIGYSLMANNIMSSKYTGGYSIDLMNKSYYIRSVGYNQYSSFNNSTSYSSNYSMNGISDNVVGLPESDTAPTAQNDYTWSWTNSAATGMASAETLENLIK